MSYDRPNSIDFPRTRKLRLRRIFEMWPLLVWLAAIAAAWITYTSGVKFRRMNGAVDVYQISISPTEDSKFESLGPNISRGVRVKKGAVIAIMASDEVQQKIQVLEDKLEAEHLDQRRRTEADVAKLDAEIAKLELDRRGALAERDALKAYIDSKVNPLVKTGKSYETALQDVSAALPDLAKIYATLKRLDAEVGVGTVKGAYEETIDKLEANKALPLQQLQDLKETEGKPLEFAKRFNKPNDIAAHATLTQRKAMLTLVAPHSGIVDRIEKEPGEFVKAGQAIVRIVGDPEVILCFLPQDELSRLAPGDKVWITPSNERTRKWESQVISVAPRMNSLADSTSPQPNRRLFGRDVVIEYPASCRDLSDPDNPQFRLLPGQTLIIHLEEPGSVPLFNRIFHNDDK